MAAIHEGSRQPQYRIFNLSIRTDAVYLLRGLVVIKDHEVSSCLLCFGAFYFLLMSYFVLLPLREEAGISIGTSYLPLLFLASLVMTALVAPACSAYIAFHANRREVALQRMYTVFAICFAGFYFMYLLADSAHLIQPPPTTTATAPSPVRTTAPSKAAVHTQHPLRFILSTPATSIPATFVPATSIPTTSTPATSVSPAPTSWQLQQSPLPAHSTGLDSTYTHLVADRDLPYTPPAYTNLVPDRDLPYKHPAYTNLVADRDLGLGSRIKESAGRGRLLRGDGRGVEGGGRQLELVPGAVPTPGSHAAPVRPPPGLTSPQLAVRALFYVWLNLQNVVAMSAMWARCADLFTSEEGARLFGFISCGATLGQLSGSLLSMLSTQQLAAAAAGSEQEGSNSSSNTRMYLLMLISALSMFTAAQLASRTSPPAKLRGSPEAPRSPSVLEYRIPPTPLPHLPATHASPTPLQIPAVGQGGPRGKPQGLTWGGSWRGMMRGFVFIWRSPYLSLICGYIFAANMVGSLLYFLRAVVVSTQVQSSNSRTAFFAAINSYSAALIALLQLFATGSILTATGVPGALLIGPVVALATCALIGLFPSTTAIAATEVIRKVLQYTVTRPAREVLFTVVSVEEKYQAKLCIDTVVLRLGDAIAASLFHVVGALSSWWWWMW